MFSTAEAKVFEVQWTAFERREAWGVIRTLREVWGLIRKPYIEEDLAADPKGWPASVNELSFIERLFGV
jgi:hypothetical protein